MPRLMTTAKTPGTHTLSPTHTHAFERISYVNVWQNLCLPYNFWFNDIGKMVWCTTGYYIPTLSPYIIDTSELILKSSHMYQWHLHANLFKNTPATNKFLSHHILFASLLSEHFWHYSFLGIGINSEPLHLCRSPFFCSHGICIKLLGFFFYYIRLLGMFFHWPFTIFHNFFFLLTYKKLAFFRWILCI